MSLADDAKLLLIPTGYKTSKVYSVFPTDGDGDFTYTRSGDASRVNPGGLIETVGTNIPRIDHFGGGCPTLNLEPQRTNLILYSEQFSGTNWGSVNTTITANQTISPDGTLTADKLQRNSTSASYRSHNISKSATATTYTTSAFIKKGSDDYFAMRAQGSYPSRVDIRFRFDTEQIYSATAFSNFTILDYGVQNYSNGWYRMHFTYTSDTHTNLSITFSPRATNGNIDSSDTSSTSFAYVWGAQTEVGSYVSSYIKTEASTVTRLVDSCEVASGLENVINQTEGVFYIEFEYLYETTTDSSTDAFRDILVMGTASDISEGISIDNYRSGFRVFIKGSGMTTQSVGTSSAGSSQPNTRYKLAVNYKSGDNKAYLNGSLLGSVQTGDVNFATDLDGIFFSYNDISRSFKNQKKVYDLRVYDTALTDTELTELTTL